jgi:hypothetical protein
MVLTGHCQGLHTHHDQNPSFPPNHDILGLKVVGDIPSHRLGQQSTGWMVDLVFGIWRKAGYPVSFESGPHALKLVEQEWHHPILFWGIVGCGNNSHLCFQGIEMLHEVTMLFYSHLGHQHT